jgi:TonB family protein
MRSRSALVSFSGLVSLVCLAALPCGWAQNTSGIFLTPVPNAPFTGVIVVERTTVPGNSGPVLNLKSVRDVARDSQGRVYNVFRGLIPASQSGAPPVIRIHFYDPQTRSYTYLYPQQKTYTTGTVNHPPAAEPADMIASPAGNSAPLNQFTKQEDLGTQSRNGVSAHGVREIQTIPASSSNTGNELVLTDEYWYSEELHMNVVVKHDDPRTGSVTMTLTQVTRTDPDPSLFRIPDDYKPMGVGGVGSGAPVPPGAAMLGAGTPVEGSPAMYHIGGPISAPRLVSAPNPEFPPEQREGGVVVVSCIVDEKGQPQQVHVIRSLSDDFDKNAVQAVEQYRFTPAMLQSESAARPVAVKINIEVNFRPK